ncbi:hypothetical protein GCM10010334_71890 [Streptomyces finlayi]|uniref:Uncharacterized protein n=1 Tax=Streptomyces finlayi TaxID=67296 RepID=A0A919CDS6_9ACTN|nr:hypothetical protein GCM10010334_71890 [Streptomyces finlayi]
MRPVRAHGTTAGATVAASGTLCGPDGSGVPCSRITWAFVPLMPNAETAERRGWPVVGQSVRSVRSSTAPALQSTCEVGRSTCKVRGRTPFRIAKTILITPATPAAACACPMLDLMPPSSRGRSAGRPRP